MELVSIEEREASTAADIDRCGLSDPLDTTDVAINQYRLAPGDGFPGGLHAHMDQEEVFVVIEGKATFETYAPSVKPEETGEITVGSGEAIRFAPGEYHSGRNEADDDLVALAIGAPRNSEDVRIPVVCPDCDHENMRLETGTGEDRLTFACPDCKGERVPKPCPECGHDDLRVTLGEGTQIKTKTQIKPIVVCLGCGVEFEQPPVRDEW